MTTVTQLVQKCNPSGEISPALHNAIGLWALATTDPETERRRDLLRDKMRVVGDFFTYTSKAPGMVTPLDVATWRAELEGRGLAPGTVYSRISRVSSFYRWALATPELEAAIRSNPVDLARPRAPKPYQGESTKALDDDQVRSLLGVVKRKADAGELVGKRDYALLLLYLARGWRRREVIGLRWGDLKIRNDGGLVVTARLKGGHLIARYVDDPRVTAALLDYLGASGRLPTMTPEAPVWISHDRRPNAGGALTSHGLVKNLKRYAAAAGIPAFHLHQLRHSFARMVRENTESDTATQEALGHRNLSTTRVYLARVVTQPDKHSRAILDRLGVPYGREEF